jgi:hypothetical protein
LNDEKVMAKKQLVMVLSEPTEGNEAEYHRYYEDLHLDEVLATTGWNSAQRFKLVDQAGADCPLPFLAFYTTDSDPEKSAIEVMNETRTQRVQTDSLNRRTAGVWVFEEIGPEHPS